jgi:predicted transcriptional regulator
MARNKWALQIGAVMADLECINDDSAAMYSLIGKIDDMMLEALSPKEREVFEWTWDLDSFYSPITSEKLANHFHIKQNHASMILSDLCQYGLLDRREEINSSGRQFIYNLHHRSL